MEKKNRFLLSPETAVTLKAVPQNLKNSPFVSDSYYLQPFLLSVRISQGSGAIPETTNVNTVQKNYRRLTDVQPQPAAALDNMASKEKLVKNTETAVNLYRGKTKPSRYRYV